MTADAPAPPSSGGAGGDRPRDEAGGGGGRSQSAGGPLEGDYGRSEGGPREGGEPVVIGRVGRPHGVRGALHVRPTGATLASLALGEHLQALRPGVPPLTLELAGRAGTDERPLLSFAGVDSRERARELVGARLAVAPQRVPSLADDPDTFYVRDLIGCRVLLGERPLGAVVEVHSAAANDVLEVAGEGEVRLVPFTADAVAEVDLGARRIVVRPDLFA